MAIKEILKDDMLEQITAGGYCYYTVKWGDNLQDIAAHLGVAQSTLKTLNGIRNGNLVYAGDRIKYPC